MVPTDVGVPSCRDNEGRVDFGPHMAMGRRSPTKSVNTLYRFNTIYEARNVNVRLN